MQITTFIYALLDPQTREFRYIGKADDPQSRFGEHLREKKRSHKSNWIQSLQSIGLNPILEIIDEVQKVEWQAAEAAYILFYKEQGSRLVNATPGGNGSGAGQDHHGFGVKLPPNHCAKLSVALKGRRLSIEHRAKLIGKHHSPETRARMSVARKGQKRSPEHVVKTAGANTGKKRSPEACARIGAAKKGVKHSAETRYKMSIAQQTRPAASLETRTKISASKQGLQLPPETRAKIAAAHKGKPLSPEHRARLSEVRKGEQHWNFGKHHSPETRAKISASWQRRRAASSHWNVSSPWQTEDNCNE